LEYFLNTGSDLLAWTQPVKCHGSDQKGPPRVGMGPFW